MEVKLRERRFPLSTPIRASFCINDSLCNYPSQRRLAKGGGGVESSAGRAWIAQKAARLAEGGDTDRHVEVEKKACFVVCLSDEDKHVSNTDSSAVLIPPGNNPGGTVIWKEKWHRI